MCWKPCAYPIFETSGKTTMGSLALRGGIVWPNAMLYSTFGSLPPMRSKIAARRQSAQGSSRNPTTRRTHSRSRSCSMASMAPTLRPFDHTLPRLRLALRHLHLRQQGGTRTQLQHPRNTAASRVTRLRTSSPCSVATAEWGNGEKQLACGQIWSRNGISCDCRLWIDCCLLFGCFFCWFCVACVLDA